MKDLLEKVKKNYKNTDMIIDIFLENYRRYNIYIRLDYYKKLKVYKLSWIDLRNIKGNNFENYTSYELIPDYVFPHIEDKINAIKIKEYVNFENYENKVTINSKNFHIEFNRYIPKEIPELFNLINAIFIHLPLELNVFYNELGAIFNGNKSKYEYTEEFAFDLFNDDIAKQFDNEIAKRGEKYYEEGRVLFLEKVGDRYFSVVGGQALYVVIIKYDEEKKTTQVYCSCPCEFKCKHIYSVIMAIRNNKFHKFYKISHKNDDMELLDRIMNFNFLLTIGIDDQDNNYLVIEDGLIKLLPVLNDYGKSEWLVVEDDDNETLSKRLENIINNKKI